MVVNYRCTHHLLVRAVGHFNISVVVLTSKQDIYLPSYGIHLRHDESHGLRNQLCSLNITRKSKIFHTKYLEFYHLNYNSEILHLWDIFYLIVFKLPNCYCSCDFAIHWVAITWWNCRHLIFLLNHLAVSKANKKQDSQRWDQHYPRHWSWSPWKAVALWFDETALFISLDTNISV